MHLSITLVRHGNTDANNEHWIQGQLDTELNKTGLDQAKRCGHRLKDEQYQHIYCSDLKRCQQTAEGIRSYQPNVSIEYDADLRERDCGELSGQPLKCLHTESSRQKISVEELIIANGGESVIKFGERVVKAYERIMKDAQEKGYERIVIVTHGGPLRQLSTYWIENDYKVSKDIHVRSIAHGNTAITTINNGLIVEFNSTSHLGKKYVAAPPTV
ncbi:histidine phosphatase superfamily [Pilaira anomala]|nr:histidine phosphatase superfamily [Pilaira anomala]